MRKTITLLCILVTALYIYILLPEKTKETSALSVTQKRVLIDVGHGGFDPGFIGKRDGKDLYEKDINLEIAKKLELYLVSNNCFVTLTRRNDTSLSNSKKGDMYLRKKEIMSDDYDLTISIHQNSFPTTSVSGAQVFYYFKSEKGKNLATKLQDSLNKNINNKPKDIKPNNTYYLFRNNDYPFVIVECGFMSNPAEFQKLTNKEYQNKLAYTIFKGVEDYFYTLDSNQ